MPKTYDVAVLGATPAGYAAALALARKKRRVVVVQCPASRTEAPLADWAPAEIFRTCPVLRPVRRTGTDASFRAVVFHSPQLDRQAAYRQRSTAGFVLRRPRLLRALAAQGRRAGIRQLRSPTSPKPQLEEGGVVLAAAQPVRASLLLIAQDSPAEVMARLNLSGRTAPAGGLTVWGLDVLLGSNRRRSAIDNALHVVTFERAERLGMFFRAGNVLHFRIVFNHPHARAAAARRARLLASAATDTGIAHGPDALAQMIDALQQSGLVPARLALAKGSAAMWRPPGGLALEMETHLAKRTLLTGTAGGFASSMTGQTLDPTIRSALVAADVADRALRSSAVQDALAEYKQQWRGPLADRIRPLGTSLQMLVPMILSNKAMAERFARAILYGENI